MLAVAIGAGGAARSRRRTRRPPSSARWSAARCEQLFIGAALGFLTRLLFSAVEAAGSLIDLSGGFSLAFAYDPLSATNTSVFGRFYGVLATTLIFATNAHLVILQGFLRTFSIAAAGRHAVAGARWTRPWCTARPGCSSPPCRSPRR